MNRTTELLKEIKDYPEDDVIKAELKGRLDREKEILEVISYNIFSEQEQKSNNVWYKKGWDDNAIGINNLIKQLTNSEGKE